MTPQDEQEAAGQAQVSFSDDGADIPPPEAAACCGFLGGGSRRYNKHAPTDGAVSRGATDVIDASENRSNAPSTRSVYHDADDAHDLDGSNEDPFKDSSQAFFDALEKEVTDHELYPIVTTNYKRKAPHVTMAEPETMLKQNHPETPSQITVIPTADVEKRREQMLRKKSSRFAKMVRRTSNETRNFLLEPRVKIEERGYPGGLSAEELAIAQRFVKELKERDIACAEQVFSLRDIEEEPYAICRFLRATKFDCDKIIERLENQCEDWRKAKEKGFYPDVSEAIGAPFEVFLTQYPFISIGNAKNGCPVNYFKAGRIQPEGILCLTTKDQVEGYFWNTFMFAFRDLIKKAQETDPDIVRCEGINVIDLEGLSSSALSSDTMDVIKMAGKIADFFPETLHCMLILNAPSFFSAFWPVIKKFIDPRTAKRIHVFSSKAKGATRLYELVDQEVVPTDYGGGGESIAQAVMRQGGLDKQGVKRQEVNLLNVRKRSKLKYQFELEEGERIDVRLYTRSSSTSQFAIFNSDNAVLTEEWVEVRGAIGDEEGALPRPSSAEIGTVEGPGKFTLEGRDIDDASKDHEYAKVSRGYFLFVGNVRVM